MISTLKKAFTFNMQAFNFISSFTRHSFFFFLIFGFYISSVSIKAKRQENCTAKNAYFNISLSHVKQIINTEFLHIVQAKSAYTGPV